jgi:hypothetical protein
LPVTLDEVLRQRVQEDARDVLRLEDQLAARLQHVVKLLEHGLVLIVREVAEAREPVDERVELVSPGELAHVALDVLDLDATLGLRRRVHARGRTRSRRFP